MAADPLATPARAHTLAHTPSNSPITSTHKLTRASSAHHSSSHGHGHGRGKISRLVGRLRSSSDASKPSHHSSSPPDSADKHRLRTASFKILPSPPKHKSPVCSANRADAQASLDLWTAAYDYLRDQPGSAGLVMAYEAVVSQELPEHLKVGGMATTLRDHPDERRFELLTSIAAAGIAKRRHSNAAGNARRIVESSKDIVDMMLTAYPSAAVAWCGFCTLTPLLLDPMLRKPDMRDGIVHVTGRISWYMFLSQLLLRDSWQKPGLFPAHQQQTRDSILRLYRKVLEFEMNCVCASASVWNKPAKNVVDWHGLGALIQAIREAEATVNADVERYATQAVRKWLLRCDRDLDLASDDDEKEPAVDAEK